jgi:hypothetical protein
MHRDIVVKVKSTIEGRYANAGDVFNHIAEVIEKSGDGNYLEIGVLNGGGVCAAGLLKNKLNHKGVVIGIDPFDGYYKAQTKKLIDKKTGLEVTQELAQRNVDKFHLDNVILIKASSPNFDVGNMRFAVSFIDGDHTEAGAFADWERVKEITDRFVVFHDYMQLDGVTKACNKAAKDKAWRVYKKEKFCFILERL